VSYAFSNYEVNSYTPRFMFKFKNPEANIRVDCKLGDFHTGVAGNFSVLEYDDTFQCSGM
jgi:hypothetical protein